MDPHSYGNPEVSRVRHLDLDLHLDFTGRVIRGTATLTLDPAGPDLVLDTRDLKIYSVEGGQWSLGPQDPILGAPLRIELEAGVRAVRIEYETSPEATALQWLSPEQTAGKSTSFLFSQSQAIHARSWVPCQDSPGVRVTYSAKVRAPNGITALMAARCVGAGEFLMPQPIPPYLMAIAAGHLEFAAVSERAGVWAEPETLDAARAEFEDMEAMIAAAERLYGPYRWGRYDVLMMPPSFPIWGNGEPLSDFCNADNPGR